MLTIRARVDAHREASDGGKTAPGLFFFELEPSPHGKAGDEGRASGALTIPKCWPDISQPESYTTQLRVGPGDANAPVNPLAGSLEPSCPGSSPRRGGLASPNETPGLRDA